MELNAEKCLTVKNRFYITEFEDIERRTAVLLRIPRILLAGPAVADASWYNVNWRGLRPEKNFGPNSRRAC